MPKSKPTHTRSGKPVSLHNDPVEQAVAWKFDGTDYDDASQMRAAVLAAGLQDGAEPQPKVTASAVTHDAKGRPFPAHAEV